MTARPILAAVLLALAAAPAAGQTVGVMGANGPTPYTLETLTGGVPFATETLAADPFDIGGIRGPRTMPAVDVTVGFSYVRPYWPNSGLDLRIPAGTNPAVGVISPYGNLSNTFGFVPRLDVSYDTSVVKVGASAQFLSVGGSLDRTVALAGGTADLLATNNLTILDVTFAEINKPFFLIDVCDHPIIERLGLEDDTLIASLGTRYTSIRQDWHAAVRGGQVNAASDATQTFTGIGLSAGLSADHPVTDLWGIYSSGKGTLLLGQNNRKTSVAGQDAGGPFANTLSENKTTLFPAAQVDVGLRYRARLDTRPNSATPNAILTLRAGVTGMYYANVGFLPAAPGTASFDSRPLFLVGFAILASVDF